MFVGDVERPIAPCKPIKLVEARPLALDIAQVIIKNRYFGGKPTSQKKFDAEFPRNLFLIF